LNGAYLPLEEARVSPSIAPFLFGDAVYEVVPVYGARRFACASTWTGSNRSLDRHPHAAAHVARLGASVPGADFTQIRRDQGHLYIQVSRGAEFGRNHAWPARA
jgi:D-alanine transaminase